MEVTGRNRVVYNHASKTATFSVVDDEGTILMDGKGQLMDNMSWDYSKLEYYGDLHELVSDDGRIGVYYFTAKGV